MTSNPIDAVDMANLRTDYPWAADEIERLQAELDALKRTREQEADYAETCYQNQRLRAALQKIIALGPREISGEGKWLKAQMIAHSVVRPADETLAGHDSRVICPAEVAVKMIDKALGHGWCDRLASMLNKHPVMAQHMPTIPAEETSEPKSQPWDDVDTYGPSS